jgi:hypothetical protein
MERIFGFNGIERNSSIRQNSRATAGVLNRNKPIPKRSPPMAAGRRNGAGMAGTSNSVSGRAAII